MWRSWSSCRASALSVLWLRRHCCRCGSNLCNPAQDSQGNSDTNGLRACSLQLSTSRADSLDGQCTSNIVSGGLELVLSAVNS